MNNNIETTSTIELIKEMTSLERTIDLKLAKYNLIVRELYKRIPTLDQQDEIKPKMLVKEKKEI